MCIGHQIRYLLIQIYNIRGGFAHPKLALMFITLTLLLHIGFQDFLCMHFHAIFTPNTAHEFCVHVYFICNVRVCVWG